MSLGTRRREEPEYLTLASTDVREVDVCHASSLEIRFGIGWLRQAGQVEALVKPSSEHTGLALVDGATVTELEHGPEIERELLLVHALHARVIEEQRELLGLGEINILRHSELEEVHRRMAVGEGVVGLFDVAARDLNVGQLLALQIEEDLTRDVDLDRVDLCVNEDVCNDDPGAVRGFELQHLPSVPEGHFSLVPEGLLDVALGISAPLAEQMSPSRSRLLLQLPLQLLVLEEGWVILAGGGHLFRERSKRIQGLRCRRLW